MGKLVLIHHAPTRTDDEVNALARGWSSELRTVIGRQGDVVLGG